MDSKFHKEIPIPKKYNKRGITSRLDKVEILCQEVNNALANFDCPKILYTLLVKECLDSICMHTKKINFEDACKLLENKPKSELSIQLASYMKGLKLVQKLSNMSDLNPSLIEKINYYVEKGYGKIKGESGHLRKRQNWIGKKGCTFAEALHYPPAPEKVPILLDKLIHFLSTNIDPYVATSIFFGYFLDIHPFMDGNGRTARILISGVIKQKKILSSPILFLTRYFHIHREKYLRGLHEIRITQSWTNWVRFFLRGLEFELILLKKNIHELHRLDTKLSNLLADIKASTLRNIKGFLYTHPFFTLEDLKKLKMSKDVNHTWLLRRLINAKVIVKKKKNYYEVSILKKIGSKKINPD
ncbi:MAG: Fic family protein [Chlamydiae bacterium]|nr:Fic family protein [Chlamydiota bacterium]